MFNNNTVDKMQPLNIKRNSGIDLLRIISMAMIVMLHTLSRSRLLTETAPSLKHEIVWLLEILCYCAVNCFVIISGFVGIHSRFRLSRIAALWMQVAFYTILFETLFQTICGKWNPKAVLGAFFPALTNTYWFFTQYLVLCFLMPFLNKMICALDKKQQLILTGTSLLFFSVFPFLFYSPLPVIGNQGDIFFTGRGYSILWFIVLYLCGAVLRLIKDKSILLCTKAHFPVICYLGCSAVTWLIHYICKSFTNPGIRFIRRQLYISFDYYRRNQSGHMVFRI